ncbi:MAG TPA: tyrosine/phenylalanine carboxypeptidase domain-containing protein [Polyangiaceae bacterium]|nr:tyrosine/phenylalanine carboxypeptidase domain-containing protein [Polyangiaceae bacterium]
MTAASDLSILEEAARALGRAEQQVRLVGRAAPRHVAAEIARLAQDFSRGRRVALGPLAHRPEKLGDTRRALARVVELTEPLDLFGRLHAARAAELELEARMAETLGTRALAPLAAERFRTPNGATARACDTFVAESLAAPRPLGEAVHLSDDATDPRSLISRLALRARELGIPLRLDVRSDLVATAATGHGVVRLRPGVPLTAAAAERIALHELLAHALPRARAKHAPWALLTVGTRGAADDEEGRAILVEERSRLLDAERRRSLALRHLAAMGVRHGAEPFDTMTRLRELDVPLAEASELVLRVHRGGGLGRELVYLPAYVTVRSAFAEEPGLERWLERGRLDLDTARRLNAGELPWPKGAGERGAQPNSTITGV